MEQLSLEAIFTPEIIADPYPLYDQLRTNSPVLPLPDANMIIVSSYQLVQAVLKDKSLGHTDDPRLTEEQLAELLSNPAVATLRRTMLLMNPPDHTRLRSLVVRAFDARRIESMREKIVQIANDLIDQFISRGEGDLVKLFTHPLPVIVICDMLGIPSEDRGQFVEESTVSGRLIDPTPMTPEELHAANESMLANQAYFAGLCAEREREPRDDLITGLVESHTEEGKLTQEEVTANIALLFGAGHETTVNLMGNGLLALYRNPEQLATLRANPALWTSTVEEFLRFDSSVQLSGRGALADTEVAGVPAPKGTQVLTLLAAANRDPDVFTDPQTFDIQRANSKPLSFGGGIHYCLGAQLARIEASLGLATLFERLPNLQLDNIDTPQWKQTITLRGVESLPAHW
jgi:cytochrome P450